MDPTITIFDLLRNNWTTSNTSLANPPEIQTGWYSRDQRLPAICLTGGDEGVIDGGEAGYTGWNPSTGAGVQRLSGSLTVDCVAGTRADCEGIGADGGDLNPKKVRWELYQEACRILMDNQSADELRTISPGDGTNMVDGGNESKDVAPVFRRQVRVQYVRDRL